MLDALLLFYVIDVPFLTAPISKPDFPVVVEHLRDTSEIPEATSTYTWISQDEIRANIQLGRSDFMSTILILNADGTVKENRLNRENSDSLYFVERFEYQDGKLRQWQGARQAAECSYRNGQLDSIHILYSDRGDNKEYYFKLRYDPFGRLAGADEITIVPNNNPGIDKRMTLTYEDGGRITVRSFALASVSDTIIAKVLLKDGRIHEILSTSKSDRTRFSSIERFTYPAPLGISRGRARKQPQWDVRLKGRNMLGRNR